MLNIGKSLSRFSLAAWSAATETWYRALVVLRISPKKTCIPSVNTNAEDNAKHSGSKSVVSKSRALQKSPKGWARLLRSAARERHAKQVISQKVRSRIECAMLACTANNTCCRYTRYAVSLQECCWHSRGEVLLRRWRRNSRDQLAAKIHAQAFDLGDGAWAITSGRCKVVKVDSTSGLA